MKARSNRLIDRLGLPEAPFVPQEVNPLDPLRKPHRVTRKLIEREGAPAPQSLYAAFDLFNRVFFDGRLAAPLVLISEPRSPRAAGDYAPKDIHGLQSVIRIAPKMIADGLRYAIATLLHEMVHAWCSEIENDMENGYRGHGPKFCAKCTAIGTVMGWGRVTPKGRNGGDRPETWPDQYLPVGDDTPRKRSKAPTSSPTEDEQGGRRDPDGGVDEDSDPLPTRARDERRYIVAWLRDDVVITLKTKAEMSLVRRLAEEIEAGVHIDGENY